MNKPMQPRSFVVDVGRLANQPCWRYVIAYSKRSVGRMFKINDRFVDERVIELTYMPAEIDKNLCEPEWTASKLVRYFSQSSTETTYADETEVD
jgi:hypothetical protein